MEASPAARGRREELEIDSETREGKGARRESDKGKFSRLFERSVLFLSLGRKPQLPFGLGWGRSQGFRASTQHRTSNGNGGKLPVLPVTAVPASCTPYFTGFTGNEPLALYLTDAKLPAVSFFLADTVSNGRQQLID